MTAGHRVRNTAKPSKLVFIDWLRPVELFVFFGNPGLVFHIWDQIRNIQAMLFLLMVASASAPKLLTWVTEIRLLWRRRSLIYSDRVSF